MKDKRSEKQKVTLYVPQDLHHKLKIRAALDCEPMSTIAERAIRFYLTHADVVDAVDAGHSEQGRSYQIHACPECSTSLIMRNGELESVSESVGLVPDVPPESSLTIEPHYVDSDSGTSRVDTGELVPC